MQQRRQQAATAPTHATSTEVDARPAAQASDSVVASNTDAQENMRADGLHNPMLDEESSLLTGEREPEGTEGSDPSFILWEAMWNGSPPSSADWSILRKASANLTEYSAPFGWEAISKCFRLGCVTWETATDDQRAVFLALPPSVREPLRIELLKHSDLFEAITLLQLPQVPEAGKGRNDLESVRTGRTRPERTVYSESSVFAKFLDNTITRRALIDPVDASSSRADIKNPKLAEWVRKNRAQVETEVFQYMCGIANIYALTVANGENAKIPKEADAVEWLFQQSLGSPNGMLTSFTGAQLAYQPSRGMAGLADQISPVPTLQNTPGLGGGSNASLTSGIEQALRVKVSSQQESRLALVQGLDHTHTSFTYKDLDNVWRPMDIYIALEDLGEQTDPRYNYSKQISTLYFAVNRKR
jgi:hypothetical protein